jgi:hypothetical protein
MSSFSTVGIPAGKPSSGLSLTPPTFRWATTSNGSTLTTTSSPLQIGHHGGVGPGTFITSIDENSINYDLISPMLATSANEAAAAVAAANHTPLIDDGKDVFCILI